MPYGWDADPEGKEELAHLTEHILFSDHDKQTEQEIKEAIDGIGGRRNGFTTPDHTWYYVTVAKQLGGFAIEWLARLMSPHSMDADVVERNRGPVALEINAQPREFFEQAWGPCSTLPGSCHPISGSVSSEWKPEMRVTMTVGPASKPSPRRTSPISMTATTCRER